MLVLGGSQGARSLNFAAVEAFAAGEGAAGAISTSCSWPAGATTGSCASGSTRHRTPRYTLLSYEPNLGDVLAAADLVVARSGGSVFEVTAVGRPSILVPFPHATADHQTENARWLERGGAATVLADAELTPARLAAEVEALLGDPARLEAMAAAARGMAKPDAARRIADEVLEEAWGWAGAASGRAAVALHRHRRGRDERPGAGLRPARRDRHRLDRTDSSYMERLRAAGLEPRSATTPPTCRRRRGGRLDRDRRRQPRAGAGPRARFEPIHRGALLAELCAEKRLIAVAGTHGKTTTTAMVVWALRGIGADPAFFVGGEVPGLARTAGRQRRLGRGRVGRRRGRRERRQLPRACDPRSPSSPTSRWTTTRLGLARPSCVGPSPLPRAARRRGAAGRRRARPAAPRRRAARRLRRRGARSGRARPRGPRPPQPAQRPRRAGGDRARRARRRRRRRGARRLPRRAAPARAEGRARRGPHI